MTTPMPRTPRRAAGDHVTGPGGWPSAVPPGTPGTPMVAFDATQPNIARAYDYLRGGKDHFSPTGSWPNGWSPSTPASGKWSKKTGGS